MRPQPRPSCIALLQVNMHALLLLAVHPRTRQNSAQPAQMMCASVATGGNHQCSEKPSVGAHKTPNVTSKIRKIPNVEAHYWNNACGAADQCRHAGTQHREFTKRQGVSVKIAVLSGHMFLIPNQTPGMCTTAVSDSR